MGATGGRFAAGVWPAFAAAQEDRSFSAAFCVRSLQSHADGEALQEEQEREKSGDMPQSLVLDVKARISPLTKYA